MFPKCFEIVVIIRSEGISYLGGSDDAVFDVCSRRQYVGVV